MLLLSFFLPCQFHHLHCHLKWTFSTFYQYFIKHIPILTPSSTPISSSVIRKKTNAILRSIIMRWYYYIITLPCMEQQYHFCDRARVWNLFTAYLKSQIHYGWIWWQQTKLPIVTVFLRYVFLMVNIFIDFGKFIEGKIIKFLVFNRNIMEKT